MKRLLFAGFLAFPSAMALGDAYTDGQQAATETSPAGDRARDDFQRAQSLKLENRFNEARAQFESIAALNAPGTETWADLAADELDYGLLLHEANYWLLKLSSGATDGAVLKKYQANAEALYRQILALNTQKPERLRETQQRLDQLYVTGQAINLASDAQIMAHLQHLRIYMDTSFHERGAWPDQTDLAAELSATLKLARLSSKRFLIKHYWRNTSDYYAVLLDTEGGPDIKLTGDVNGSRLVRVQP